MYVGLHASVCDVLKYDDSIHMQGVYTTQVLHHTRLLCVRAVSFFLEI